MTLTKPASLIILIILTFFSIRFLFANGFYTFSDESHLANFYEMIRAVKGGQFPPRWAPDFSYNYGYPFFDFNYVFPYYVGLPSYFLGWNLVDSLKIVFGLSMFLSVISFYFLASELFSETTAIGTSLLYVYTPYRALNLYARGAVGEMWAFVFLPLTILGVIRLNKSLNILNFILTAFSVAGLILSHNLTALIFTPLLILLVTLLSLGSQEKVKYLLISTFSILTGFLLSSYYWVPAILELSNVSYGTPFNPTNHFPTLNQLISTFWGYGASVFGPGDGLSFQIGFINILGVILGVIGIKLSLKNLSNVKKYLGIWLTLVFILAIFLMNFRSSFIWQNIRLLSYIQFPWRFLTLTTLSSALFLGFAENIKFLKAKPLILIIGCFSILFTWQYFMPGKQVNFTENDYLKRFFINRTQNGVAQIESQLYHQVSEDYIPLLKWTKVRPSSLPKKVETSTLVDKEIKEITPTNWQVNYSSKDPFNLTFNNYYYPGWVASVDAKKIPIEIGEPFGQLVLKLPEGTHTLNIIFQETMQRKIADLISISTFVTLLILISSKIWIKKR